jgi:hypothetical protein
MNCLQLADDNLSGGERRRRLERTPFMDRSSIGHSAAAVGVVLPRRAERLEVPVVVLLALVAARLVRAQQDRVAVAGFFLPPGTARYTAVTAVTAGVR